ncbi:hypothetical protein AAUPMC_16360, partial [Pasteurella multocida subsp. multocida str. Anand1_cattle]
KVEPFSGDLEDYQKWLTDVNRNTEEKADTNALVDNANSSAYRKEQKRREAELRQQTAPLRKKLQQLEQKMETVSSHLGQIEAQLVESDLYLAENKKN